METNLVAFTLRWTGTSLLLAAEPVPGSTQAFSMQGMQLQRFRFEHDVLQLLERTGIGRWSTFPPDSIQATVTRSQLWQMGFRGNY